VLVLRADPPRRTPESCLLRFPYQAITKLLVHRIRYISVEILDPAQHPGPTSRPNILRCKTYPSSRSLCTDGPASHRTPYGPIARLLPVLRAGTGCYILGRTWEDVPVQYGSEG
jgi:hypothetical protein